MKVSDVTGPSPNGHSRATASPRESRSTNLQVAVTLRRHGYKGGYCSGPGSVTSRDEVKRAAGDEEGSLVGNG